MKHQQRCPKCNCEVTEEPATTVKETIEEKYIKKPALDWGRRYRVYLVLEEKDLDAFDVHLSILEKYYEDRSGSQEKLESLKRIRKELEESADLIELVEE